MKQSISIRTLSTWLLAVALTSGSLFAQTSAGSIVGLVRDAAGAVSRAERKFTTRAE